MNSEVIDKAFQEMISEKGIETKLGVDRNYVYQLRNKIKNGVGITLDTKIELLRKSGWKENEARFTRAQMIDAVKFALKTSTKAKEFGPEYIVEKWQSSKKLS